MEARRRQPECHVAVSNPRSVQNLFPVDDPHDGAGHVVLAGRVEAGHFRSLAAEERDAVFPACPRHPLQDFLQRLRLEPAGGDVVEEKQRRCALDEDVVDAVVDEIRSAGVVASRLESDLELRPDAVRRSDEHRLPAAREIRPEKPSEPADVAEDTRRECRPDDVLCARERRGFGVDVDSGGGVTGGFQEAGIVVVPRRRKTLPPGEESTTK